MNSIADNIIKKIVNDKAAWVNLYDYERRGDATNKAYVLGLDGDFELTAEESKYIKNLMEDGDE